MFSFRPIAHVLTALLALAVLALLLAHEILPRTALADSDFITYLGAAHTVRQGGNPFAPVAGWIAQYSGGPLRANYYVYSPIFALLLVPLTFLSAHLAWLLWGVCNVFFLAGTVFCCLPSVARRSSPWLIAPLTAAIALLSPIRMDLQWGQADCLLALLLSASFLAVRTGHPVVGGVLLGLAAAIKTPLLALAFLYLWKQEPRAALSAVLAAAVLIIAPPVVLGGATLHDQLSIWSFWSSHYTPFIDNIAPRGVLARLFTTQPTGPGVLDSALLAWLLWLAVAGLCLMVVLRTVRRQPLATDDASAIEFSLSLCCVLLISPLTEWIYLTLLCIPLILCIPILAVRQRASLRAVPILCVIAIYLVLCAPLNHLEYSAAAHIARGGPAGVLAVFGAAVYLYPLVAIFALLLVLARRSAALSVLSGQLTAAMRGSVYYRDAQ